MPNVDPLFAQWLQGDADTVLCTNPTMADSWGATALMTQRTTGIALHDDAKAEAERQLSFFARGPFVIDVHQVEGTDWQPYLGRVITLTNDQLGYETGVDVFLIGVEADRSSGYTALTVVRPLPPAK